VKDKSFVQFIGRKIDFTVAQVFCGYVVDYKSEITDLCYFIVSPSAAGFNAQSKAEFATTATFNSNSEQGRQRQAFFLQETPQLYFCARCQ